MKKFLSVVLVLMLATTFIVCADGIQNWGYSESVCEFVYSSVYADGEMSGNTPQETIEYEEALNKMKDVYKNKNLVSETENDVSCFWDMLAKSALNGITDIGIDYNDFNYTEMSAQRQAKLLITAVNNKDFEKAAEIAAVLKNSQLDDGSFNNTSITDANGIPYAVFATEQVWAVIAMEIADEDYNSNKAFEYIESCRNADGGYGYGSWSDVGTTSWIITAYQLAGKEIPQTAIDFVLNQWQSLVDMNDSSSMSAYISTKLADEQMMNNMLASYSDGYFIWGDYIEINEYSTGTCSQALADYKADKNIYTIYDELYVKGTTNEDEDTGGGTVSPDYGDTNHSTAVKQVKCTVTIDVGNVWVNRYSQQVPENSTVVTLLKKAMEANNIEYNFKGTYLASITKDGVTFGEKMTAEGLDGLVFYINGEKSTRGMEQVKVSDGDEIVLKYVLDFTDIDKETQTNNTNKHNNGKAESEKTVIEDGKESEEQKEFDYKDAKGHWAEEFIKQAVEHGLIKGYEDGTYGPDNKVTRAEFVTMLYNILSDEEKTTITYSDVSGKDWFYNSIAWATNKGLVKGFYGIFNPNGNITRQDMAVIISRVVGEVEGEAEIFDDVNDCDDYAKSYIENISKKGIIKGDDSKFYPKSDLTRAEAVVVILRMMEIIK